jgi:hypothetical protein
MKVRDLANTIAKQEGKTHQASVGDVREILKITLTELAALSVTDLGALLKRYTK